MKEGIRVKIKSDKLKIDALFFNEKKLQRFLKSIAKNFKGIKVDIFNVPLPKKVK
jgi:hypothetical protein